MLVAVCILPYRANVWTIFVESSSPRWESIMMLPPVQKIRIASGLLAISLAASSMVANHEASEQDELDPVSVAELVVPEVLAGAVSDNSEGERPSPAQVAREVAEGDEDPI
ncbi:hypothetical protein [Microbacterium hydrocarbonoxydans]|uniref:hypothetical protein n=1 Tax=Microbacterium hydrocarbonoxydans TaxID=273678 RepID=UPI00203E3DAD|nr:hypothetical protein [Microbacterium hydrocarbonoxydans]MCM3780496.1 hypothetical protein [Microbacterium hydrocarbonoxydans]